MHLCVSMQVYNVCVPDVRVYRYMTTKEKKLESEEDIPAEGCLIQHQTIGYGDFQLQPGTFYQV